MPRIEKYKHRTTYFYKLVSDFIDKNSIRRQYTTRYWPLDSNERIGNEKKAWLLAIDFENFKKAELYRDYASLSFYQWHESFLKEIRLTMRNSTVTQYDGDLRKWLPKWLIDKKLEDITREDIHKLIFDQMSFRGASAHTQRRILKSIHRIFEVALENGLIARNPSRGIKIKVPPPNTSGLNSEEAQTLLERAFEEKHPFYSIWAFALLTGLRSGELYALRWSDIDIVSKTITVSATWSNKDGYHPPKSNKFRVVPISDSLAVLLKDLKRNGPYKAKLRGLNGNADNFDDLVLPRIRDWKNGEQAKVLRSFCVTIGISPIRFHDLRSTFATNLLSQGAPLAKVSKILGHNRITTTEIYLRMAGVAVEGITERLSYSIPTRESGQILRLFNQ